MSRSEHSGSRIVHNLEATPAAVENNFFFDLFRALIRERCGIRVPDNKQLLLRNRIGKRLKALGYSSYKSYYDFVMSAEGMRNEIENLWSVVTTHQTYF